MRKILIVKPHRDPMEMEAEKFSYGDFERILKDNICFESVGDFDLVCCDNGGDENMLLSDEQMLHGPFILSRFDNDTGECLGLYNTDIALIKNSILMAKEKCIPLNFFDGTWKK